MKKLFRKSGKKRKFAKYNFFSEMLIDPFFKNAGFMLNPFNVISNCKVAKLFIQGK